jgi:uncharacterized protein (DUF1015 family)
LADIRPFRGVTFNTGVVGGLRKVVGPPEDIPSPEQAEAIVKGHPFHAVRLEMSDPGPGECFVGSAQRFRSWLDEGVLVQSETPAFYVHQQEFNFNGERRVRSGVFAALQLHEYADRVVLPHENTMPHNVEIRTRLLRSVKANLSAVYTLIEDRGKLEAMLTTVTTGPADEEGVDSVGGYHRLWKVTNPSSVRSFRDAVASHPLFIADGHHRYVAALNYRDELRRAGLDYPQADWTLSYITYVDDPGVLVLPIHRVIQSLGDTSWDDLRRRLTRYYDTSSIPLSNENTADEIERAISALDQDMEPLTYLLLEPGARSLLRLHLRDWDAVCDLIPDTAGTTASHLDVTVFDCVVLRDLLGFDNDQIEQNVDFTKDVTPAFEAVRTGRAVFAGFVRPTPLSTLMTVARAGGRMPQKSTYFYPKIPIGLLMRDLLDEAEEGE